jgi:uncharacterized protein YuzE
MAIESLSKSDVKNILSAVPQWLKFPARKFEVDYDEEADVVYISFRKPQRATESEFIGDDIVLRTRGNEVVGLTILYASKRNIR